MIRFSYDFAKWFLSNSIILLSACLFIHFLRCLAHSRRVQAMNEPTLTRARQASVTAAASRRGLPSSANLYRLRRLSSLPGPAAGSSCSNHKQGFPRKGPMGAGGRRGLPRGRSITARPARALLSWRGTRGGSWLLFPSCPRWPSGCSGPRRAAVSVIAPSTSR